VQTSSLNRTPEASLSALCRALEPAPVRVSFSAQHALPFRVELPSSHGLLFFHGATADAAAAAALQEVRTRRVSMSFAVEPTGEGEFVDALREWIDRVTPSEDDDAVQTPSARPLLRLVR
jgi:hypothetical protein